MGEAAPHQRIIMRPPWPERIGSLFATALIGAVGIFMLGATMLVETRLEAYTSVGMVSMHRSYALKLKTGRLIMLGEDRALNTAMASSILANTVKHIVRRGKLEARDLGMAEGRGGILLVLFTAPPSWDAPSLSDDRQATLWRAAGMTGQVAVSRP